jgi:DNA-3-methyladenine glycosylase
MILDRDFYLRQDVVLIARELLGKVLVTNFDGRRTGGIITETEAYNGVTDRASHAYGGRRTERTEIMYHIGGTAYVYLCYGVHSLFNIVSNSEGIPDAILIRGIKPTEGIPLILKRCGKTGLTKDITNGPGKVSKALGIHFKETGLDLATGTNKPRNTIWVEDQGIVINPLDIKVTPRIGINYAGEDALLPYRFVIDNKLMRD